MDYRDLVAAARLTIVEVGPNAFLETADVVIDVRESHETAAGTIGGAIALSRGMLEGRVGDLVPDRATRIGLYCSSGWRSALAAKSLKDMGYSSVVNLDGGFDAWKAAGLPWTIPDVLTADQTARYARHTRLAEVGERGQQALLDSRVAVVGAGGLGSPVLLYLAAAGVGSLTIIDDDHVDISNLQRQVVHSVDRVGWAKTESARRAVEAINRDVSVTEQRVRITGENAASLLAGHDVIVDGTDNLAARYVIGDSARQLEIPVVHGSVFRFEGQVTVFGTGGPCYRCLFPDMPPPELAPSCADAGVLGVLPAVIGSLQATETLKLLLGIGASLEGRLVLYDALSQQFTEMRVAQADECVGCGGAARATSAV